MVVTKSLRIPAHEAPIKLMVPALKEVALSSTRKRFAEVAAAVVAKGTKPGWTWEMVPLALQVLDAEGIPINAKSLIRYSSKQMTKWFGQPVGDGRALYMVAYRKHKSYPNALAAAGLPEEMANVAYYRKQEILATLKRLAEQNALLYVYAIKGYSKKDMSRMVGRSYRNGVALYNCAIRLFKAQWEDILAQAELPREMAYVEFYGGPKPRKKKSA